MTLAITAAGIASFGGSTGLAGLAAIARWPGAPEAIADPAASQHSQAVRRRTGNRYLDPMAEHGIRAIEAAGRDTPSSGEGGAWRTGILLVTRFGPASTRGQLYASMRDRRGVGASATLFSNCGYNIAAAVMAKVQGVRGPSLTLAATPRWGARVLRLAEVLFARDRVDRLFVGCSDGDAAIVLRAERDDVAPPSPARALYLALSLDGAQGEPRIMVRSGLASDGPARAGTDPAPCARAIDVRVTSPSSLALDPTFLSIAWLWECSIPDAPGRVVAAIREDAVVAFDRPGSGRGPVAGEARS